MPDLFESPLHFGRHQPLASRLRPTTLDDFVGQDHILGTNLPLRRAIELGSVGSMIFVAPPGCGKTTLANIIATTIKGTIQKMSAISTGVADIRKTALEAEQRRKFHDEPTVVLLDEIHHFNKSQQDVLLPFVEEGAFTLIGATTENPRYVINSALLSRVQVFELKPLANKDLRVITERALSDPVHGILPVSTLEDDAFEDLANHCQGDARKLLGILEAAALCSGSDRKISRNHVLSAIQSQFMNYDRKGDHHYDTISAYVKSMRSSETDAALHYLARMLSAGEDPRIIARRLVVFASEDIGNADPQSLVVATSALSVVQSVGMPESQYALAQATTYLAEAPKSDRVKQSILRAKADVESGQVPPIPNQLKSNPLPIEREIDSKRTFMPDGSFNLPYYSPSDCGYEAKIKVRKKAREGELKTD